MEFGRRSRCICLKFNRLSFYGCLLNAEAQAIMENKLVKITLYHIKKKENDSSNIRQFVIGSANHFNEEHFTLHLKSMIEKKWGGKQIELFSNPVNGAYCNLHQLCSVDYESLGSALFSFFNSKQPNPLFFSSLLVSEDFSSAECSLLVAISRKQAPKLATPMGQVTTYSVSFLLCRLLFPSL